MKRIKSIPSGLTAIAVLPRYSAKRNLHRADFLFRPPQARRVSLVDNSNHWNPTVAPMSRVPDGRRMASLDILHGYHQYLFLVDGKPMLDPNAKGKTRYDLDEPVSLVAVS
jgi:1,4-alpha-glucan branching enzyme